MSNINLDSKIEKANKVIYEAFRRYGNRLSFCYNGGKDSIVLLDLVLRCAQKMNVNIKPFYLEVDDEFDEIVDFISFSEKYYGINLIRLQADNLKDGLEKLVNQYQINSVFLGVRGDDIPNIKMKHFEPTTNGWPEAERVMPILEWTYSDIWDYIDRFNVPYCTLYNFGYTSIGPKSLTIPNPKLYDPEKNVYLHARYLTDPSYERLGRTNRNH
ncbi:hypothetical protein TVAG_486660 [Trichomonas vaginalis G3]|uniref:FAD synthase n=1 Tax=Trichomonas vaginalis (strain ATCC PRA-98 / G3) TaxID=412133 RepID=A2DZ94_TRIV3|nr:flavin adenine dinucleotide biosynthetic process [Trichomonas vaginalis G3]EAY14223.1 hypothetical protein TVAG_486660 [Trichomonas vaginalis G3]KAI5491831.1 flavin adenine dinucleotide biosynthetic process [Trichomonas vaginalis G3]|eukprot:XP_001326446.1 hypothetical protein [Trichomonas vaginalis G3]